MASSILRFHSLTARLLKDAFLKDGFRQNFFSKIFVLERILLKEFFDLILREVLDESFESFVHLFDHFLINHPFGFLILTNCTHEISFDA